MALPFQAATLDVDTPDREATLVFRDGRLLAVLSCLSDIHAEPAGSWFMEAVSAISPAPEHQTFDSLERLEERLATRSG